jgi:hypothetical protein
VFVSPRRELDEGTALSDLTGGAVDGSGEFDGCAVSEGRDARTDEGDGELAIETIGDLGGGDSGAAGLDMSGPRKEADVRAVDANPAVDAFLSEPSQPAIATSMATKRHKQTELTESPRFTRMHLDGTETGEGVQ